VSRIAPSARPARHGCPAVQATAAHAAAHPAACAAARLGLLAAMLLLATACSAGRGPAGTTSAGTPPTARGCKGSKPGTGTWWPLCRATASAQIAFAFATNRVSAVRPLLAHAAAVSTVAAAASTAATWHDLVTGTVFVFTFLLPRRS
jgi:hypothetical protein